jgi:hypothetical protein
MTLIDPFGWQNSFFMGWTMGMWEGGLFWGIGILAIPDSGRYVQAVINLLNSGLFWQKRRIWITAGRDKSRITDPFF